ncbi:MAG: CRTAC1 family protein, partial [Flavobacteriaceae bacterium]
LSLHYGAIRLFDITTMDKYIPKLFTLSLFSILLIGCEKNDGTSSKNTIEDKSVFINVPPQKSGLIFANHIKENLGTLENLFNYDYFYNGAGVGIEDLNNDGLLDIFFCGNQVENRLFFNQGDMVFKDVTEKAMVNVGKQWSNGTTFVDINQDGWMDIYVSQGGPNKRLQRKNLLFINQQDGSFTEESEEYGLADMGISTQTVFFDYDKDGDLDCLVMNENELYGFDPISLFKLVGENDETKYFNSSHLYRNDDSKFVDVTKESGLERPIFGLGISVSDINDDGWLDIYIASDYYIPDALFINNADGTFTDQIKNFTNQISYYGMGMDIADINNDGLQDIFVLDMAANDHVRSKTLMASMNTNRFDYLVNKANFHHQYMYNSLQLNMGHNQFSTIAQASGMANTDWSWSVLLQAWDLDGDRDIHVTNGYRRYALDNDLQRKVYEAKVTYNNQVPLEVKKALYDHMPSEKLPNILFENHGNLNFTESATSWGLADHTFSNGAAMGDLDNDGDLDLVVNNMDQNCFLYQNQSIELKKGNFIGIRAKGLLSESYPKIVISHQGKSQFTEIRRVRGYRSAQENIAHFGLGKTSKIDTITVTWPSGKTEQRFNLNANTIVEFNEADATSPVVSMPSESASYFKNLGPSPLGISFEHRENAYDDFENEILLPYKQSTQGPYIAKADVKVDSLEDLYIGGASG